MSLGVGKIAKCPAPRWGDGWIVSAGGDVDFLAVALFDAGQFWCRGFCCPVLERCVEAARHSRSGPMLKLQGEAAAARGVPSHPLVPHLFYSRVFI